MANEQETLIPKNIILDSLEIKEERTTQEDGTVEVERYIDVCPGFQLREFSYAKTYAGIKAWKPYFTSLAVSAEKYGEEALVGAINSIVNLAIRAKAKNRIASLKDPRAVANKIAEYREQEKPLLTAKEALEWQIGERDASLNALVAQIKLAYKVGDVAKAMELGNKLMAMMAEMQDDSSGESSAS